MATIEIEISSTEWTRITNPGDYCYAWKKTGYDVFVCQTNLEDSFTVSISNTNLSIGRAKRVPLDMDTGKKLELEALGPDYIFYAISYKDNQKIVIDALTRAFVPTFLDGLIDSSIPEIGPNPTYTASSTSALIDFEGVIHTAKVNETRMTGARRVENLCTDSETYATETITVFSGINYIFSMEGTGSVTFSGAATGTLNGVSGNRVEATKTTTTTSLTITVSGSVLKAQLEQVKGSQTQASEYVSTGELSAPYHGANVDGVKYFSTDRDGNNISLSILKGYRVEPETENLLTYSEEFDNAAWNKVYSTVSADQILAPDGTKTADAFLADSTADTVHGILQYLTMADNADIVLTCFVKAKDYAWNRLTCRRNNGSYLNTWFNITDGYIGTDETNNAFIVDIYDSWFLIGFKVNSLSGTTPFQFYNIFCPGNGEGSTPGTVTGTGTYIWGSMVAEESVLSSYIKTEGTTVTRVPSQLLYSNTNNTILPNSFTMLLSVIPAGDGGDYAANKVRLFGTDDLPDDRVRTYGAPYLYTAIGKGGSFNILTSDLQKGYLHKFAFQLYQNGANVDAKIFLNGVKKLDEQETQTLSHSDIALLIGYFGSDYFTGNIKDITIYRKKLSDAEMISATEIIPPGQAPYGEWVVDNNGDYIVDNGGDYIYS